MEGDNLKKRTIHAVNPARMNVHEFLTQLATPLTGEELFDHLTDVVYFIKDARGAYLVVNQTLVARCGVKSKADLLGKTSVEIMGQPLGQQFTAQDQQVLATGAPLVSQLELHVHRSGLVGWCLTTKLPLRNVKGKVVGLVGVSQDLRLPNLDTNEYRQVSLAIQYAEQHLDQPPKINQLAQRAGMSIYQLDRRMQSVFGLTTGQWILKSRLDRAQLLLKETEQSIAVVASKVGYADQSAFSRQFRAATGLTPNQFRQTQQVKV